MTRATERWQDAMRYTQDTGSVPRGARRCRWPLAVAAVVGTGAFVLAVAASSGRGPGNRAWVDPDGPTMTLASAGPAVEPARRRSYTRIADAGANAAADPGAIRSDIAAAREPLARPEPATTGAIAPASHDETRPAERSSSPALRSLERPAKRPMMRQARLASEPAPSEPRSVRKAPADPREGAGKREADHATSSARAQRRAARAVAANTRAEWAGAVAPARVVSVCLYGVVCF